MRCIKERVDAARHALLRPSMEENTATHAGEMPPNQQQPSNDEEKLAYSSPAERYHIAQSQRHHDNILNWLGSFGDDPALTVSFVTIWIILVQVLVAELGPTRTSTAI